MSNMSYCRFENTYKDLLDCAENVDDELEAGGYEDKARKNLIKTCFAIVQPFLRAEDHGNAKLDMEAVDALPVDDEF